MTRRLRVAVLALCVAGGTPACSIGARAADAERVGASFRSSRAQDTVVTAAFELAFDTGEVDRQSETTSTTGSPMAALVARPPATNDRAALAAVASLQGGSRNARVLVADDPEPAVLFIGDEVFVHRQNARSTERRRWARLDLAGVRFDQPVGVDDLAPAARLRATAAAWNPAVMLELVAGVLAGSLRRAGLEGSGDAAVERFDCNLSFDKAMTDLDADDDERRVRLGVFRRLGVMEDVVKASVWLDRGGELRRFQVVLPVEVSPILTHRLQFRLELRPATDDVFVSPPDPGVTVTYESLGRLVRSAVKEDA